MVKVVYASLGEQDKAGVKSSTEKSVRMKRVRMPDGSSVEFASLDADGPDFVQNLTSTFRRNVARARRENLRLTGRADVADRKS